MHLYKYSRGSQVAVTRDPDGKNLPSGSSPWTLVNEMTLHLDDAERIGASSPDIIKGIEDHGYYILPERAGAT